MKLTAHEAWQIATDAARIATFRDEIDMAIEKTAKEGGKYTILYIGWFVSQAAIESLAQEYRDAGYTVGYHDDSDSKLPDCGYTRGFWLEWKDGADK